MAIAFVLTVVVALAALVGVAVLDHRRKAAIEAATAASARAEGAERERAAATVAAAEAAEVAGQQLTAVAADLDTAAATTAQLRDELDTATARAAQLSVSEATLTARVHAATVRQTELEAALAAEAAATSDLRAELATATRVVDAAAAGPSDGAADGPSPWGLLLVRVERQWAAGVSAGPDERGVGPGTPGEQLTAAVGHELDRLREEAGLYAELRGRAVTGDATVLLAVGEALATLATASDHLTVELDHEVRVLAEGWTGPSAAVDSLVDTLAQAGLALGVHTEGGEVRLTLPLPAAPDETHQERPTAHGGW